MTPAKDAPEFLVLPANLRPGSLVLLTKRELMDLIEDAPLSIFLTEELRIAAINRYALPTFGQVSGSLGMELPDFLRRYWAPDAADQTISVFKNTLATGTPYSCIHFTADRAGAPRQESYHWEVHRLVTADAKRMLVCYFVSAG